MPILFVFLISHFRNELDTNQTDFIFSIVITKFFHRIVYFIGCRLLEIVIDIKHMVFVHDFLQEIVDIPE